jgi:hypothetical protein
MELYFYVKVGVCGPGHCVSRLRLTPSLQECTLIYPCGTLLRNVHTSREGISRFSWDGTHRTTRPWPAVTLFNNIALYRFCNREFWRKTDLLIEIRGFYFFFFSGIKMGEAHSVPSEYFNWKFKRLNLNLCSFYTMATAAKCDWHTKQLCSFPIDAHAVMIHKHIWANFISILKFSFYLCTALPGGTQ